MASTASNAPDDASVYQVSLPQSDLLLDLADPLLQPLELEKANEALGEGAEDGDDVLPTGPSPPIPKAGKPQVIVRIRPSPQLLDYTEVFQVDPECKSIQIRVDRDTTSTLIKSSRRTSPPNLGPDPSFVTFPADNVLEQGCGQEETFHATALEVVEKAMQGIPGMLLAVGPEVSGKSYSLFGLSGDYKNRGLVPRVLEKLFELREHRVGEILYRFGLGVVEVRRERIRDLLTLAPDEINDVGNRGPKGMYVEELEGVEQAIGLLLRALIGQKMIHTEPYERFHTLTYIEIAGVSALEPEVEVVRSRITFAEIASVPYKPDLMPSISTTVARTCSDIDCHLPPKLESKYKLIKQANFPPATHRCCNPGHNTGPLAESIAVRRDVFALEQIFLKANEQVKAKKYFEKLDELGLSRIVADKRRFTGGYNLRQTKLTHCLKDIMDGSTEIRILLHVRPDKAYLRSTLEAMRFAQRAKLVPVNLDEVSNGSPAGETRTEDQILQDLLSEIGIPELLDPETLKALTPEKMKQMQETAVQHFEAGIESMKVCSKDKVKVMFENFRVLWNFLWEVELNVSLRKTEGTGGGDTVSKVTTNGEEEEEEGGDQTQALMVAEVPLLTKKSSRKQKKGKKKEKKLKDKEEIGGGGGDASAASAEVQQKRISKEGGPLEGGGDLVPVSSQILVEDQAEKAEGDGKEPPTPQTPLIPPTAPPQETTVATAQASTQPRRASAPSSVPPTKPLSPPKTAEGGGQTPKRPTAELIPSAGSGPSAKRPTAELLPSTAGEGQRSLGSRDYGPRKLSALSGSPEERKSTGEESGEARGSQGTAEEAEEQEPIIPLEELISANFEEMKKVARRQAIHLIRAGVKRPQWMSLF